MTRFILPLALAARSLAGGEVAAIPSAFPPERYEALIARSPFALATPAAPPAAPADKGYAEGWYVSGLARLDGADFVTIKSRDQSVQFSLFGNEPGANGVALERVAWSPEIGRSTVTIKKDGQVATLEFNQAEIQAPATAPAPPPPLQAGGRPGGINNGMQRPAIPRPVQPIVPPGYGGNAATPNQPGVVTRPGSLIGPGNANPAPGNRSRIRVINNNLPITQ